MAATRLAIYGIDASAGTEIVVRLFTISTTQSKWEIPQIFDIRLILSVSTSADRLCCLMVVILGQGGINYIDITRSLLKLF